MIQPCLRRGLFTNEPKIWTKLITTPFCIVDNPIWKTNLIYANLHSGPGAMVFKLWNLTLEWQQQKNVACRKCDREQDTPARANMLLTCNILSLRNMRSMMKIQGTIKIHLLTGQNLKNSTNFITLFNSCSLDHV